MIFEPTDEKGECDFCEKTRKLWYASLSGGDFNVCKKCGEEILND